MSPSEDRVDIGLTKEKQSWVVGLFQSVSFCAAVEPEPPVSAAFRNYLNPMERTVKVHAYVSAGFR